MMIILLDSQMISDYSCVTAVVFSFAIAFVLNIIFAFAYRLLPQAYSHSYRNTSSRHHQAITNDLSLTEHIVIGSDATMTSSPTSINPKPTSTPNECSGKSSTNEDTTSLSNDTSTSKTTTASTTATTHNSSLSSGCYKAFCGEHIDGFDSDDDIDTADMMTVAGRMEAHRKKLQRSKRRKEDETKEEDARNVNRIKVKPMHKLGWFQMWHYALKFSDYDVARIANIDSLMMLKFYEMCIFIMIGVCATSWIIGGVNYFGVGPSSSGDSTMVRFSVLHMFKGVNTLYAHSCAMWFITAVAMLLIWHYSSIYKTFRFRYLMAPRFERLTIMFSDIPNGIDADVLSKYLCELSPQSVVAVQVVKEDADLEVLINERDSLIKLLKQAQYAWTVNENRLKTIVLVNNSLDSVDAITWCRQRLPPLDELIYQLQQEVRTRPAFRTAFVTFSQSFIVNSLAQCKFSMEGVHWRTSIAPEKTDILWVQVKKSIIAKAFFSRLNIVITCCLSIFYIMLVAVLQGIVTPSALTRVFPGINTSDTGILYNIFVGWVPAFISCGMFSIIRPLLYWLAKVEGTVSETGCQVWTLHRYSIFCICYFLLICLSGSILDQINLAFQSLSNFLVSLGLAIPSVSTFFMIFTVIQATIFLSFRMLNTYILISGAIKYLFFCKTPEEKRTAWIYKMVEFSGPYVGGIMTFIIGFSFAVLSPFPSSACLYYFIIYFITLKMRVVYCFEHVAERGGDMWPYVCKLLCVAMVIGYFVVGIFLSAYESYGAAVILLPLPFLIFIYYYYLNNVFFIPVAFLPTQHALALDRLRKDDAKFLENLANISLSEYVQPSLLNEGSSAKRNDHAVNKGLVSTDDDSIDSSCQVCTPIHLPTSTLDDESRSILGRSKSVRSMMSVTDEGKSPSSVIYALTPAAVNAAINVQSLINDADINNKRGMESTYMERHTSLILNDSTKEDILQRFCEPELFNSKDTSAIIGSPGIPPKKAVQKSPLVIAQTVNAIDKSEGEGNALRQSDTIEESPSKSQVSNNSKASTSQSPSFSRNISGFYSSAIIASGKIHEVDAETTFEMFDLNSGISRGRNWGAARSLKKKSS